MSHRNTESGTSKGLQTAGHQEQSSYTANRVSFDEDLYIMTDPSGNIDFFISYRGPQAAWARWINWVVRTAGYSTTLMAEFQVGTTWTSNMRDAAEKCRRLIPLYSDDYWASGACVEEFDAYWRQHMQNNNTRFLLPLVIQKCTVPDMHAMLLTAGLHDLNRNDAQKAILTVLTGIAPIAGVSAVYREPEPPFPGVVIKASIRPGSSSDGIRLPLQLPPAAVGKFYGRVKEAHQLQKRLQDRLDTAVVGPAGYGKTALAAKSVEEVVGRTTGSLAESPYPDGVVFLDLYSFHAQAEQAWHQLANDLRGAEFLQTSPAQVRATEACRERRLLVIIEGGEEADGGEGRVQITELLSVLSSENRCLLLTRDIRQARPGTMIRLDEPLSNPDAGRLFDSLTGKRVKGTVRDRILALLAGHPLGLTWAGGLLARDDEDPRKLADDWEADPARLLSDPMQSEHTLEWLFARSVRGLDEFSRRTLAAAGLLARAPFPVVAIEAALGGPARDALKPLVQRGLLRLSAKPDHREFTHVLGYRFARNESSSDASLRTGLAGWLHRRLSASLTLGANSTDDVPELLQHAAALLRTDREQQLWEPLAIFLLYKGQARLLDLGRLDWVNVALGAVSAWLNQFPGDKAAGAFWQRERSVCFNSLGNLAVAMGNLPEAQRLFGESLRIRQRLAESDTANAGWQFDLGISNERLGDLAAAQGNLDEAHKFHSARHAIIQRLADSDPANAAWQRDLSVSFEKLGDLATSQGNLPEAQRLFGESLRIRQRLAKSDPANAAWQRDLSVSFEKLGDLAKTQGNLPEAQRLFGESLRSRQRLAKSDPANAEWQRDLFVSFGKLGELATAQGNLPEAQRLFGESLRSEQRLAESDPANAEWQRDLWVSYWRVARVLEQQGSDETKNYWRQAHDTLTAMVEKGLFVSPQDMQFLDTLRAKVDR